MVVVENGGKVTGFVVLTKICFQIVPVPAIFRLCGTTHSFPRFRKIIRVGFVDEVHYHVSNSGAHSNRHPLLIVSGWQD